MVPGAYRMTIAVSRKTAKGGAAAYVIVLLPTFDSELSRPVFV